MADTYAVAVTLTKQCRDGELNIVNWLDILYDCASEDEARGAGVRMAQCDNPTHSITLTTTRKIEPPEEAKEPSQ